MQCQREQWLAKRKALENAKSKRDPRGPRTPHWSLFEQALDVVGVLLKLTGLESIGKSIAIDPKITQTTFWFDELPTEFDDFLILHMSDLHLDAIEGLSSSIASTLRELPQAPDLTVLTGDYRDSTKGPYEHITPLVREVCDSIPGTNPIYFTLGNHDCHQMLEEFEAERVIGLMNESVEISKGGQKLTLTGIDDVHYFYTDSVKQALQDAGDGFKIALVHSAEIYEDAAAAGYDLYLNGHTHGGQICLPGGVPIFTHHTAPRSFASGYWRYRDLQGYTNRGAGVVKLPVRFFCQGELALIRLRRGRKPLTSQFT